MIETVDLGELSSTGKLKVAVVKVQQTPLLRSVWDKALL